MNFMFLLFSENRRLKRPKLRPEISIYSKQNQYYVVFKLVHFNKYFCCCANDLYYINCLLIFSLPAYPKVMMIKKMALPMHQSQGFTESRDIETAWHFSLSRQIYRNNYDGFIEISNCCY